MNPLLLLWIMILVLSHLISGSKQSEESSIWSEKNSSCPPWSIPNHDNICMCGSSLNGIVDCNRSDRHSLTIKTCYCMTMDQGKNKTVVGNSPYACTTPTQWHPDPDELNTHLCNDGRNRTGVHNVWTVVGLLLTPIPCIVFNARATGAFSVVWS